MKLLEFYFNTFLYNVWPPFCRVGFPLMLVTTVIAMIYLLICHVAFKWHPDWLYIIVLYTIYNKKRHVQNLLCSPPQQRFKNPLLSLTDFMCNGNFLHRYIFSWYLFCNTSILKMQCILLHVLHVCYNLLWIQWIIVISSVHIFLFNNCYITIKVTSITDCDIFLYIIVHISI